MNVDTINRGTFSADLWRTGVAGFTDSDPNSVAPTADKIATFPEGRFAVNNGGLRTPQVTISMADGTSATVRVWFYDDTQTRWVELFNVTPLSLTYASGNAGQCPMHCMPGARVFCQIVSNTDGTKFAVVFR